MSAMLLLGEGYKARYTDMLELVELDKVRIGGLVAENIAYG
jgi:hypothetical protein